MKQLKTLTFLILMQCSNIERLDKTFRRILDILTEIIPLYIVHRNCIIITF